MADAVVERRHRLKVAEIHQYKNVIENPANSRHWVCLFVEGDPSCGLLLASSGIKLWHDLAQVFANYEAAGKHTAWKDGYTHGYDDREKMDHDRADIVATLNPHPEIEGLL